MRVKPCSSLGEGGIVGEGKPCSSLGKGGIVGEGKAMFITR